MDGSIRHASIGGMLRAVRSDVPAPSVSGALLGGLLCGLVTAGALALVDVGGGLTATADGNG
jgi:predicted lipid-binding transport protein (Tim44 family)